MPDVCHSKSGPPCEISIDTHTSGRRVGVDVIQFPKSYLRNKYAVVFVDYLTKWPEVFPTSDQTALTIACLLVEQIVELLSDRGAAFLSNLPKEVCQLMNIHKVNTTAYHPHTDRLVERFTVPPLWEQVDLKNRNVKKLSMIV